MRKAIYIVILLLIVSCEYLPTIKEKVSEDPPIARVNDKLLFKKDVQDLFKPNISEQDSILIIKNHIDSWAKQQLLLHQAEINLERESLEFEKLVEDYRSTLYINAYKEALVSNKLDTIVTDAQVKQFYLSNHENFRLNEELVQLKYIHLNNERNDEKKLIKLFKSKKREDIEELESMELEFISHNFNDTIWVKYNEIFNKINVLKSVPKKDVLKKSKFIQKEDSLGLYLITIKDVLLRNDTAPISYITPTIKQIILQKRKLELLRKIEVDLLNDAIKNKNLKNIKMIKKVVLLAIYVVGMNGFSQERVKIDGVAVVIGKNIVLDSDIEKFKLEVEQRSEGKIQISDCEMLEEIMTQKLLSHHAVIDSIVVTDDEVKTQVDRVLGSFTQQLGSIEKVIDFYGFNDEDDLRKELSDVQKDQILIQRERSSIVENIEVTPDEVRTYFNNLKEEGNLPELGAEIELSQIVIYAQPSEAENKRIIDKLNKIKEDIEAGSSMQMKALLNSDDPSVSGTGPGSGGFYTINRETGFVKEFKEVAFSLNEGEISDAFKTQFGYHIIQVEKIKGQQIDIRHILIQPEIDEDKLLEAKSTLAKVKKELAEGTITFEDAVKEYSQEDATKANKGIIVNPATGDSHFELTRMDPTLYSRVSSLNASEVTDPFYDETREGEKMFKILLLKSKTDAHKADYADDYVKVQQLATQKKQEETIDKWASEKIADTYIKINEGHKDCTFDKNWSKK